MNPLQIAILQIISDNDGEFSWYQIDRALSRRGTGGGSASGNLLSILRELEMAGLVAARAGHHAAQPLYSVTPAGQQQLGR
jgi:DNA-binding PadR family transcriptional regulator